MPFEAVGARLGARSRFENRSYGSGEHRYRLPGSSFKFK
jgi:hypothetical protein